jgi:hypothetical protein
MFLPLPGAPMKLFQPFGGFGRADEELMPGREKLALTDRESLNSSFFRTASVSRPSASAAGGLLSANCRPTTFGDNAAREASASFSVHDRFGPFK